ncbi:MAG: glycosyltransferase [Candidatus Saccharibacteria bacterium]|nr:glycosyltransferase [Candidatus Saccharibacteria bacterium]
MAIAKLKPHATIQDKLPAHAPVLSIVVPLYNEAVILRDFHSSLFGLLDTLGLRYELIYCNDGSSDDTAEIALSLAETDRRVKVVSLTRNFGKEIATTAGITVARGQAIMTLDADGQHPIELIPEFIERWQAGEKAIIGVRVSNQREGFVKKYGSKLFYKILNSLTGRRLVPGVSDFRLIDKSIQREFIRMTERNRITRGLIDWLGYRTSYLEFDANARMGGMKATYSVMKLFKLATDSFISMSVRPLYLTAYFGAIVLPLSLLLGLVMVINFLLGDPFNWHVTGGAYVMVLILFLIGVIMVSQGITGMYLSHIHTETQNRPLYVVDRSLSKGIEHE